MEKLPKHFSREQEEKMNELLDEAESLDETAGEDLARINLLKHMAEVMEETNTTPEGLMATKAQDEKNIREWMEGPEQKPSQNFDVHNENIQ